MRRLRSIRSRPSAPRGRGADLYGRPTALRESSNTQRVVVVVVVAVVVVVVVVAVSSSTSSSLLLCPRISHDHALSELPSCL